MPESWLYQKLGRPAVTGTKSTLAIFRSGEGIAEALSEQFLTRLNPNTIYFTLKTPAEDISMPMAAMNMIWVDATGAKPSPSPGFPLTRVPTLKNLVALSSTLGTMVSGGNHSFLVVNSLNELLAVHGPEKTAEFVDFLASRAGNSNVGCLFLLVMNNKETAKFAAKIVHSFDSVVRA